ncbi:MAG: cytochrome P450 [Actinobacteria bacterium]|nr:cytochrome P450 [Actinomycetota bacterium]
MTSLDFKDPDFINNPYPALKELRSVGAPVWHDELGVFLAAKYNDANDVLRTKTLGRIFVAKQPANEWQEFNWLHSDSLLDSEPPKHTRLRSLVAKAFNRHRIEALRPDIERLTDSLLDEIAKKKDFDIIADYAEPLPVKVIASLLGFPDSDEYLLRPWSQAIVKMYEVNPSHKDQIAAQTAGREFAEYVHGLMLDRKVNPGADLISELAQVEEAGEKLSTQELIATCVLLLNAGHEASVNGFGNGIVAAWQHPSEWEKLQKRPFEVAETAVEEFLRFDAPLHYFERTATADTQISGVMVAQGQKIVSLLGSANRDEEIFANSDEMNVERNPNPHIGFGAGIHFCLGGPLARLEMSISLPALFARFPDVHLVGEPLRRPTFSLRGYETISARI